MKNKNILLIGMAGSVKSTLGILLAKKLHLNFIDSDEFIEKREGALFQEIIDDKGEKFMLNLEEGGLIQLSNIKDTLISSGGSAIYCKGAMKMLKKNFTFIFLNLDYTTIHSRLTDANTRGIIGLKNKTLKQLYSERQPLYKKYADITINVNNKSSEEIVQEIIEALN